MVPVGRAGDGGDADGPVEVADPAKLTQHVGVRPLAAVRRRLGRTPPDAERSVTVLRAENEGTDRLPLTPWISGHRAGYAIVL